MATSGSEPVQEYRDIRCSRSDSFAPLLAQLRPSVLISTYQTGHVVVVSARDGRLKLAFNQFERAMGIAAKPGTIAVCTRKEVWFLRDAPDIAARLQPPGQHDACFLARTSHFTDDIRAHEAAWVGRSEFWIVNTLFSCLSALHPHYSFAPRWRPPFISALRPEDRCHLNGLAVVDGKPRYVTALGESDTPAGWRAAQHGGGCIIEVPSGRVLARGLSVPHSPRVDGDRIFFLQSGMGDLAVADPKDGLVTAVTKLPGVLRGLTLYRGYAFKVGLSSAAGAGRKFDRGRSASCAVASGWSICARASPLIWSFRREWKRSSMCRCCRNRGPYISDLRRKRYRGSRCDRSSGLLRVRAEWTISCGFGD